MGKSSLLARLYQYARDSKAPTLYVDFQSVDDHEFETLNGLLRSLADRIARCVPAVRPPAAYWVEGGGAKGKLTNFMAEQVLDQGPISLFFDEVDRLFKYPTLSDDFFGMLRAWYNLRAIEPGWQNLNLVLGYSTEARLFIKDRHESPFNVGVTYALGDFEPTQVMELNARHGHPIRSDEGLDALQELLSGHPFLLRKALYDLVTDGLTLDDLRAAAFDDDGPFGDHLQHYLWHLEAEPEIREAMHSVLRRGVCETDWQFYRLRAAGLVRGAHRNAVAPRCGLYAEYFKRRL